MKKLSFFFLLIAILYSCSTIKYVKENELLLTKNTLYIDSNKVYNKELNELLMQRPNMKTLGIPLSLHFYNLGNPKAPQTPSKWGKKHPKTYSFFKSLFSEKQSIAVAKSAIGLNNWFLKNGQAPVVIDDKKTKKTVQNLKTYYQNHGYFKAKITTKKDTVSSRKGKVTYHITKGTPLFLDTIFKDIKSPVLDSIYKLKAHKSYLKSQQQYKDQNFINEANRLTKLFRNSGIYHFNKTESIDFYIADTSKQKTNIELVISDKLIEKDGKYISSPFSVQKVKNVNVITDYAYNKKDAPFNDSIKYKGINFYAHDKLRYNPKYLSQSVFIKPNSIYSDTLRNLTRTHLRGLKNFKSSSVIFRALNKDELEANIFLTPTEKYTLGFDTELSRSNIRNFDISGKFSIINRNTFKGAEIFKLSASGSYFDLDNGTGWEIGTDISLEIPRFMAPFGFHKFVPKRMFPKTNIHTGFNIQKNIGLDKQNVSIGIDYKWNYTPKKTIQLELLNAQYIRNLNTENYFTVYSSEYKSLQKANDSLYSNNPLPSNQSTNFTAIKSRIDQIQSNASFADNKPDAYLRVKNINRRLNIITSDFLIPEIAYSFTYNNRENIKDLNFSFFKIRIANSGNIMGILSSEKNQAGKTTLFNIPIAQYFKTDIEYKKYWNLGNNSSLAHRTFLGSIFTYNNAEIPFSRSYFAGGSNDIRAWRAYDLGPGTEKTNLEFNIGSLKFLSSFEYRFDVIGSLKSALFIDAGNIWDITNFESENDDREKFQGFKSLSDLAVGGGFGLRYDLKFLIFRLDFGFKMHEPYLETNKWFRNFNFANMNLNIGINYPF